MFSAKKFGRYVSSLRKQADMTQSELAEKLNVTRQAVSHYEQGNSFPDVSILVLLSDLFKVTLDELIASGEPTRGEMKILSDVAVGRETVADSIDDMIGVAPYLKPGVLQRLSESLATKGIDISNVVALAEYLNDESICHMLKKTDVVEMDDKLLEKLLPVMSGHSVNRILQMILEGEMDWRMLRILLPYREYMHSQVEAAVVEGYLPWEALDLVNDARKQRARAWQEKGDTPANDF